MTRILVVDDEPAILRAAQIAIGAQRFDVVAAATGRQAVEKFSSLPIDLVIVDLGLPDISGLDVIRRIRTVDGHVPIIVLSAWQDVDAKVEALDLGADDYVEKPFSMPELLARVRVALRRVEAVRASDTGQSPDTIERGPISIDLAARVAHVDGHPVELTRTQFDLLCCFARHPQRVLTHRAIATEVWGAGSLVDSANLRMVVSQLRRKIEQDPAAPTRIRTVLGIGYVFDAGDRKHGE